ncbi:DNA polymerase III beta subunit [Proteus phage vB_PmiM_ZX7]|nr:DNA polymerase III beta subunit [Proteus phage vB_PmiM_ZX7]
MKITIPYKYIKSADIFRDEKDVRTYCKGFIISDGKLITTNGHYLFITDVDSGDTNLIFNFIGKIPTSADAVEINFTEKLATFTSWKKGVVAQMGVEVLYGQIPKYKSVTESFEPRPVEEIGFQHKYLNDISKAGKAVGVDVIKMEFGGASDPTIIRLDKQSAVYILPCRI